MGLVLVFASVNNCAGAEKFEIFSEKLVLFFLLFLPAVKKRKLF